MKLATLPPVRSDEDFKEKVMKACNQVGLSYSVVLTKLLEDWLQGSHKLEFELDQDFINSCKRVINSDKAKDIFMDLALKEKDLKFNYEGIETI
ncbi:MAG: hypothetical protein JKY89_06120 [Immundisolibacteraceae bacterium]|nr:hypothetical protein [Immundisolibacteraceae bacterium]